MKINYKVKKNLLPGPNDWVQVIKIPEGFEMYPECLGHIFQLGNKKSYTKEYWLGFQECAQDYPQKYPVNYKITDLRKLTKEEIIKYKHENKNLVK